MNLRVLGRVAAVLIAMQVGLASAGGGSGEEPEPAPSRTVKERLAGKASDEQRVNNCKVPFEQRGAKPRPDTCPDSARTAPKR